MRSFNLYGIAVRLVLVSGLAYIGWHLGESVGGRTGAIVGAVVTCLLPIAALGMIMSIGLRRYARAALRTTEEELHACLANAGSGRIPANIALCELRRRGAVDRSDLEHLCRQLQEPAAGRAPLAAAAIRSAFPELGQELGALVSATTAESKAIAAARIVEAGSRLGRSAPFPVIPDGVAMQPEAAIGYLQSQDAFEECIFAGASEGDYLAASKQQCDARRLPRIGLYGTAGKHRGLLYRWENGLRIRIDEDPPLSIDEVASSSWTLEGDEACFTMYADGRAPKVLRYKASEWILNIERDWTPFVSAEDFDVLLFIHNVLQDKERQARLLRSWQW